MSTAAGQLINSCEGVEIGTELPLLSGRGTQFLAWCIGHILLGWHRLFALKYLFPCQAEGLQQGACMRFTQDQVAVIYRWEQLLPRGNLPCPRSEAAIAVTSHGTLMLAGVLCLICVRPSCHFHASTASCCPIACTAPLHSWIVGWAWSKARDALYDSCIILHLPGRGGSQAPSSPLYAKR